MTLGPSGAGMLRDLADRADLATPTSNRAIRQASTNSERHSPEKLESFFQAAMERFLKEQRVCQGQSKSRSAGDQDVEMVSSGSPNQPASSWEYDPDDLDVGQPARAAVVTATTTTSGQTLSTPRVSVMSKLKEFSGKDGDEDRARSWISKVKSAFVRDQAPDEEKCLVIGDLLTGSWKDQHQSFQIQYCGRGVSVARQYYHARKRSDESPLEYLYHHNVAGLRARLQVKDGSTDVRREHVEYFIEMLDDRDLADQSLAISPARETAAGTRAIRVPSDSSDSDEESGESADESFHRVYLAATTQQERSQDQRPRDQAQDLLKQDRLPERNM
ncbi:hypothetical protein ON010_g8310 [Phytophthora cinnamomi]|nr:hypothetical protein ON010_g8310 [Phytophthora cinnamomi]